MALQYCTYTVTKRIRAKSEPFQIVNWESQLTQLNRQLQFRFWLPLWYKQARNSQRRRFTWGSKAQPFKNILRTFFKKNPQKFRNNLKKYHGIWRVETNASAFLIPRLLFSKTQNTYNGYILDITSKVLTKRAGKNGSACFEPLPPP